MSGTPFCTGALEENSVWCGDSLVAAPYGWEALRPSVQHPAQRPSHIKPRHQDTTGDDCSRTAPHPCAAIREHCRFLAQPHAGFPSFHLSIFPSSHLSIFSPFTIHHSPFTIHHSPFTSHQSSVISHHSPFTIHHLSVISHQSPFTIHHHHHHHHQKQFFEKSFDVACGLAVSPAAEIEGVASEVSADGCVACQCGASRQKSSSVLSDKTDSEVVLLGWQACSSFPRLVLCDLEAPVHIGNSPLDVIV